MGERESPDALRDELRSAWQRYVDQLVPLRPDLYLYCRQLAGNVWIDGLRRREVEVRAAAARPPAASPEASPETMYAVGDALGLHVRTGLYRFPTPAPGEFLLTTD